MGDIFIWRVFNAAVIGPGVFGRPRDKEAIAKFVATEVVDVMNYLETRVRKDGYFLGPPSIADISIIVFFANLSWSRVEIDDRWPKMKAWSARLRAQEPFASLERAGATLLRTPIPEIRDAARSLGTKVTAETFFTPSPRLGPMTVLA